MLCMAWTVLGPVHRKFFAGGTTYEPLYGAGVMQDGIHQRVDTHDAWLLLKCQCHGNGKFIENLVNIRCRLDMSELRRSILTQALMTRRAADMSTFC
jgi:hypothetical protein